MRNEVAGRQGALYKAIMILNGYVQLARLDRRDAANIAEVTTELRRLLDDISTSYEAADDAIGYARRRD